jgi:hypothetical protein
MVLMTATTANAPSFRFAIAHSPLELQCWLFVSEPFGICFHFFLSSVTSVPVFQPSSAIFARFIDVERSTIYYIKTTS